MPFTIFPPGSRKGNRFWLVRGKVDGRDIEFSTKTRDETSARILALEFERKYLEGRVPSAQETVTWSRACELYKNSRNVSKSDTNYLLRLEKVLGSKDVRDITQADLDDAARRLYPAGSPETVNRQAFTPAIAVLSYAALNRWCQPSKWKRPKQRDPETRAAAEAAGRLLIRNTDGKRRLLILWLWKQGTRITDTVVRVAWERIDLRARTYEMWIGKSRKWKTFPLDTEVWEELTAIPEAERKGKLFPWSTRQNVYRWLRPLVRKLGIEFTPHMARHRLGRDLNASGAGLRTIMDALGQKSPKAALRYMSEDVDSVRRMQAKRKRIAGRPAGN